MALVASKVSMSVAIARAFAAAFAAIPAVVVPVLGGLLLSCALLGCEDRANPTPSPAPANTTPAQPVPSQPEPAKPDATKPEPAKPEPAKPEPANPEQAKPDPAKPAQAEPAPAQPDPNIVVNKGLPTTDATIGGKKFKLEVAATPETRTIGMMGRTSIPDGTGLLFVFPPSMFGVQSFWMNNCLTDMDILYLDNSGRILTIHTMTKPEPKKPEQSQAAYENSLKRYSSRYPCGLAIEIAPGEAKKLGLKEGDLVKLDIPALKKMAK